MSPHTHASTSSTREFTEYSVHRPSENTWVSEKVESWAWCDAGYHYLVKLHTKVLVMLGDPKVVSLNEETFEYFLWMLDIRTKQR